MKTYTKPETDKIYVEALNTFTGADSVVGNGILTKRNDAWEFEDEDEDGGLW